MEIIYQLNWTNWPFLELFWLLPISFILYVLWTVKFKIFSHWLFIFLTCFCSFGIYFIGQGFYYYFSLSKMYEDGQFQTITAKYKGFKIQNRDLRLDLEGKTLVSSIYASPSCYSSSPNLDKHVRKGTLIEIKYLKINGKICIVEISS